MKASRPLALGFTALIAALTLAVPGAASGLKTKSKSVEVAGTEVASPTAKCKRGQRPLSGGFAAPVFDSSFVEPAILLYESIKAGRRGWRVSGQNAGAAPGTLTAYAYCARHKALKKSSAAAAVDSGDLDTQTASCKRGQRVVSGGFDSPDFDPTDSFLAGIVAHESRRTKPGSWTVSALNNASSGTDERTLEVHAYCRGGTRIKTSTRTAEVAPYPDVATATAKCKRGQRAIAGGFDNPEFDPLGLGPFMRIHESRKIGGRKWTVSGFNLGLGAGTLEAYVHCEKKG
jgi:hypothetical protein